MNIQTVSTIRPRIRGVTEEDGEREEEEEEERWNRERILSQTTLPFVTVRP